MTDQSQTTAGWWVPTPQYWRQTLLPQTGAWQQVRTSDGKEHTAVVLSGRDGWWDMGYKPIANVTDWFKPAKWFRDRADLEGYQGKLANEKSNAGSILRSAESHD